MDKFVVGKTYECSDRCFDPLTVISRTEKFVTVTNTYSHNSRAWRTKVDVDDRGEYIDDKTMPRRHRDALKWRAIWELDTPR